MCFPYVCRRAAVQTTGCLGDRCELMSLSVESRADTDTRPYPGNQSSLRSPGRSQCPLGFHSDRLKDKRQTCRGLRPQAASSLRTRGGLMLRPSSSQPWQTHSIFFSPGNLKRFLHLKVGFILARECGENPVQSSFSLLQRPLNFTSTVLELPQLPMCVWCIFKISYRILQCPLYDHKTLSPFPLITFFNIYTVSVSCIYVSI